MILHSPVLHYCVQIKICGGFEIAAMELSIVAAMCGAIAITVSRKPDCWKLLKQNRLLKAFAA